MVYKAMPGDMTRVVLGTLREAKGPLTTKQITLHVMAHRGIDTSDENNFQIFRRRVGSLLRNQRSRGVVRAVPGEDGVFMMRELAIILSMARRTATNHREAILLQDGDKLPVFHTVQGKPKL